MQEHAASVALQTLLSDLSSAQSAAIGTSTDVLVEFTNTYAKLFQSSLTEEISVAAIDDEPTWYFPWNSGEAWR